MCFFPRGANTLAMRLGRGKKFQFSAAYGLSFPEEMVLFTIHFQVAFVVSFREP